MAEASSKFDRNDSMPEKATHYGHQLYRKVWEAARQRNGLEGRWYEDTLQYHGYYDETTQQRLDEKEGSSKIFVNITRQKARVLRARLIDLLFPTDQAHWDIQPTPVPRIERALKRREQATILGPDERPLMSQEVAEAQRQKDAATEACDAMRALIRDQLVECNYLDVGRDLITQAVRLGVGVVKGPFRSTKMRRAWKKSPNGAWSVKSHESEQPRFEFVNTWDFYPDPDCSSMRDCEYTFQLHRMSREQLRRAGKDGIFDPDTVRFLLNQGPLYAPDSPGHFNDMLQTVRQLESETDETGQNRWPVFEYNGPVEYEDFAALCEAFDKRELLDAFTDPEDPLQVIHCSVWFCSDQVLRFAPNPLESGALPYSVFRLDPSENSLLGSHGVPRTLRAPQQSLNASWRLAMESGGLEGVPMFVFDRTRVKPANNRWEIHPGKVWWSETGFSPQEGGDPIRAVAISGNLGNIVSLVEISRRFVDDESNLPLVPQQAGAGDGAAGAKQTAHGLTLLANQANVLFRDAARGFDADVTLPNLDRLYEWNMLYSDDDSVKGDMEVKPLGSSVLLVNELVSQNMLMLMNLAAGNPDLFTMLKFPEMVRVWFRTLHLSDYNLVLTDAELQKKQEELAKQAPPPDPAIEAKREIAQLEVQREQMRMQAEERLLILKLAAQEGMTMAQIEATLEKARLTVDQKNRQFAAEAALKERHGTGV